MNVSKTNELLKDVKTNLSTIDSVLDDTYTNSNSIVSNIVSIQGDANTIRNSLTDIDTTLDDIQLNINDIKDEVVNLGITIASNKKYIHENVEWDGGELLSSNDHSSTEIIGQYTDDSNAPLYITKYTFNYIHPTTTIEATNMYHSSGFNTKIGRYRNSTSNFAEPFFAVDKNRLQYQNYVKTNITEASGDTLHRWEYDFRDAPVEIGVSEVFGHRIMGDFSGYSGGQITGIVEGYHY